VAPPGSGCRNLDARVWVQNYQRIDDAVRWRSSENIPPPSRYIGSPYDQEAHYSKKQSTTWVGYKIHLTESCEAHLPLLITHVETTSAPVSDDAMTATIHAELNRKELLPAEHIVDTGYVDAKLLVESQRDYQVDLVGPTRRNHQWQGRRVKRLRCRPLSHRLGTATGHVPGGTHQQ
jgi:transposase